MRKKLITLQNPFNQPDFQITDAYVKSSIEAAAIPHTDYTAFSGHELPGDLFVIVVEKDKFRNDEQAMICLMQRMIILIIFDDEDLSSFDEESITNLTNRYCLGNWYTELEYTEMPADYFMKEADWLFKVFADEFSGKGLKELVEAPNGPNGFFINKQPVEGFGKINPLNDEIILKLYSLVNYNDGKYFFAISEKNYILLNWQSGGPMHLLAKPEKRIPGSLLLSSDAFYDALGIKKIHNKI